MYYFDPVLKNVACLLTIHNSDRQGWFPRETVEKLLLPWDVYTAERAEFYGTFDFLKGGIVYSDAITTVSRKYAEEIQTPEFGNGLDGVLRARAQDLHGILNGVDYQVWDPATDSKIAAHYTPGAAGRKVGLPQGPAARFRCFQRGREHAGGGHGFAPGDAEGF